MGFCLQLQFSLRLPNLVGFRAGECCLVYFLILFWLGAAESSFLLLVLATTWWGCLMLRSVRLEKVFVTAELKHLILVPISVKKTNIKFTWRSYAMFTSRNTVLGDTEQQCNNFAGFWDSETSTRRLSSPWDWKAEVAETHHFQTLWTR